MTMPIPSAPIIQALRSFPYTEIPYTNVTPLTIRDNATIQWEIEKIISWIRNDLIPHVDGSFREIIDAWIENATNLVDSWNELSQELRDEVAAAVIQIGNAAEEAKEAQIKAEEARDQAEMFASQAQAVQDEAVTTILEDSASRFREALNGLFAPLSDFDNLVNEIDTGRLSESSLNARFTLKADKTYVDAELDGKADRSVQDIVEAGRLSVESLDDTYAGLQEFYNLDADVGLFSGQIDEAGYGSYDFLPEEFGIKWENGWTGYTEGGWDGVRCRMTNDFLMVYGVAVKSGSGTGVAMLRLPPNIKAAGQYQSANVQLRRGSGGDFDIRPNGSVPAQGSTMHVFIIVPLQKPQPSPQAPVWNTPAVAEASAITSQAWSSNQVNSTPFRKSPIATGVINGVTWQYAAYWGINNTVYVIRRQLSSSTWSNATALPAFSGEAYDAHNSISIAIDGNGYVHIAWSSHSGPLHYARNSTLGDMDFSVRTMVGNSEDVVTYPEFYRQSTGDLLFLYRNGVSGNGQAVLNKYSLTTGTWNRIASNLISGGGERSAYWQACIDSQDRLHVSWTWRETGDVSSNHDIMYMRSTNANATAWVRSNGQAYALPVTQGTAEVAAVVPQRSALMNQTSMTVDADDNPIIASYWREGTLANGVVDYHIVRYDGAVWNIERLNERRTNFDLAGAGTKRMPLARPLVVATGSGVNTDIRLFIRDDEAEGRLQMLRRTRLDGAWTRTNITMTSLGQYEPSWDIQRFMSRGEICLYVQYMRQAENEGLRFWPRQNAYAVTIN